MTWAIAKKEFYAHLLTFRVWAAAVLCFILVPFVLQISIKRYQEKVENYHLETARFDAENRAAPTYSFVRPTIVRTPQVLSIISPGIGDNLGDEIQIRLGDTPFMPAGSLYGRGNSLLAAFTSIDLTFVILVVLSLFSVLLTHDAVCGEKSQGTLQLIFTTGTFRRQLLAGKYLGSLLITLPLVVCIYLIAGLMMIGAGVPLSAGDILSIILIMLLSSVYCSIFLLLGLLISARTGHPALGLMFSVFVWILLVIVLPTGASHLARTLSPAPERKNIDAAAAAIDRETDKRYQATASRRPDEAISLLNFHNEERPDGGLWIGGNSRESYDYLTQEVGKYDQLLREAADRKWDLEKPYLDALLRQRQTAFRYACISPAFLFRNSVESVAGAGTGDFLHFLEGARAYRQSYLQYLGERHRTHPYRYISPDDERQIKPAAEWISYWTNGKFRSYAELYRGRTPEEGQRAFLQSLDTTGKMAFLDPRNFTPLDLTGMPVYRDAPAGTAERISGAGWEILLLVVMNILLFALSHAMIMKYDVRYG